jgi:hypothetical protein
MIGEADRVRLHADLTIPARLSLALAARGIGRSETSKRLARQSNPFA